MAGISQMLPMLDVLYQELNQKNIVLVLDKDKRDRPTKNQESLEADIKRKGLPYIQPDKYDDELMDATDWNDVAQIKGKIATQKAIHAALDLVLPRLPEVLGVDSIGYQILSYLTKCVHTIPHGKPLQLVPFISPSTITKFKKIGNVTEQGLPFHLMQWLQRKGQNASDIDCLGLWYT